MKGEGAAPRGALREALVASALVTALVTAASRLPERAVAFTVAAVFLAATWLLVWRRDDAEVERFGVAFGGLLLPGRLDPRTLLSRAGRAMGWAVAFSVVVFPFFAVGFRAYWAPTLPFALDLAPLTWLNSALGQLVVIALPEEAFYRGYLQTRLAEALPGRRLRIFGADIGFELLLASLIFALGHVATIRNPGRLAVFFPALLFGYLRARTGSVSAGVAFHAMCNLFSEALGRGYGMY